MKLVILAAGEGIRMRPLTLTTPKPLLTYRGKTALDHLFLALPDEINEVIMVVKYLNEKIRAYCGENFHGKKITYVEGEQNGNALGFLKTSVFFEKSERFAVAYADDVITAQEINDCLKHKYSWLCYTVSNPREVGIAVLDDKNRIIEVVEKPENPASNLATDGFMVMDQAIFSYTPAIHPAKKEYYFTDLMTQFSKNHEVIAIMGDSMHTQLTSPEDIERLNSR